MQRVRPSARTPSFAAAELQPNIDCDFDRARARPKPQQKGGYSPRVLVLPVEKMCLKTVIYKNVSEMYGKLVR